MEFDQFETEHKSTDDLFKDLVIKALENKNSKFEFIRNYDMLRAVKLYRSGVRRVHKMFKSLEYELLTKYAKLVKEGTDDLTMVMAIKQFAQCVQYYKKEHAIADDMLKEYRTYVMSGHILAQLFFNGVRPEEECVDYRKLPIKWF